MVINNEREKEQMKRILKAMAVASFLAIGLSACGDLVEVPPAYKGIILDANGYKGDFIEPSKFRLDVCFIEPCPQLVLISTQDQALTEEVDVFLPKSDMPLEDVEGNLRISMDTSDASLRRVLDKVPPVVTQSGHKVIQFADVYRIYGRERVRATIRQAVADQTLEFLLENREAYSSVVMSRLVESMAAINAPVIVKQFSFAKLNPPEAMKLAFLANKQREIALATAEADKLVRIKQASANLEVAKKTAATKVEIAKGFKAEAKIMSEAITPEWLQMRRLEVMEKMAKNGSAVFFPTNLSVGEAVQMQTLRKIENLD